MKLIDADKGLISKIQLKTGCNFITAQKIVDSMPTVQAIPLDKVKQAKEEITAYIEPTTGQWTSGFNNGVNVCGEILDKLIAESEKANNGKKI